MNAIPKLKEFAPEISDEEKAQRKAAIDYARGSVRLEGFVLDAKTEVLNQRFINGELTLDELGEAIRYDVMHG